MEAWVHAGAGSTVNIPATMISDRMKDEYYSSGIISGFMGLTWTTVEQVYENDSGALTFFVPDGQILLGNYTDQRPLELMIGPTADDEAPDGFTGKFAKTWKDKDPSARQYLLEWNLLPVIQRPEQMLVATGVVQASAGGTGALTGAPAGYWLGSNPATEPRSTRLWFFPSGGTRKAPGRGIARGFPISRSWTFEYQVRDLQSRPVPADQQEGLTPWSLTAGRCIRRRPDRWSCTCCGSASCRRRQALPGEARKGIERTDEER